MENIKFISKQVFNLLDIKIEIGENLLTIEQGVALYNTELIKTMITKKVITLSDKDIRVLESLPETKTAKIVYVDLGLIYNILLDIKKDIKDIKDIKDVKDVKGIKKDIKDVKDVKK